VVEPANVNGFKFEMFVFDVFELAEKLVALEVLMSLQLLCVSALFSYLFLCSSPLLLISSHLISSHLISSHIVSHHTHIISSQLIACSKQSLNLLFCITLFCLSFLD
jgi:hypothetical protein